MYFNKNNIMKTVLLLFLIFCELIAAGQKKADKISILEINLDTIQAKQAKIEKKLCRFLTIMNGNCSDIQVLEQYNAVLYRSIDSLKIVCDSLQKAQMVDRQVLKRYNAVLHNSIDRLKMVCNSLQNAQMADRQVLKRHNAVLYRSIDSLKIVCDSLQKVQISDGIVVNCKIEEINSTQINAKNRILWGGLVIAIILFVLLAISYCLTKRIKRGASSINEMRKVQDALQNAYMKMQEESIKLDNKMIELCEQQIHSTTIKAESIQPDHSLALKVADEIVRIELNLSRMDASVKGYKQLAKAVERIKNNFQANGYEIVDMLGKPYSEGMKVVANFVPDETLREGEQVISGVTKPQINYNGKMIQSAQITVSQNI